MFQKFRQTNTAWECHTQYTHQRISKSNHQTPVHTSLSVPHKHLHCALMAILLQQINDSQNSFFKHVKLLFLVLYPNNKWRKKWVPHEICTQHFAILPSHLCSTLPFLYCGFMSLYVIREMPCHQLHESRSQVSALQGDTWSQVGQHFMCHVVPPWGLATLSGLMYVLPCPQVHMLTMI